MTQDMVRWARRLLLGVAKQQIGCRAWLFRVIRDTYGDQEGLFKDHIRRLAVCV